MVGLSIKPTFVNSVVQDRAKYFRSTCRTLLGSFVSLSLALLQTLRIFRRHSGNYKIYVARRNLVAYNKLVFVQINAVLTISGFKTGKKNPQYNNLAHPLEITWLHGSSYANAARGSKVPDIELNYITIADSMIADSDSLVGMKFKM